MRNTRDTFLHFLSDNLPAGTVVHAVRRDTNNPAADQLQSNAVNVQFLTTNPGTPTGTTIVDISVVYLNELDALATVFAVWQLLSSAFYTPKLNYSSGTPVPDDGSNVMWHRSKINFKPVTKGGEFYFHFSCLLTLEHTITS